MYVNRSAERVELVTHKAELVRHIFQGLILGSGVNWAEDEALTALVLTLGMPTSALLERDDGPGAL